MAQLNAARAKEPRVKKTVTHEGGQAYLGDAEDQLRRTIMCCLLWEDNFYENGESLAERVKKLVPKVKPEAVKLMAVQARHLNGLRHAPLLLAREMVRHNDHKALVAETLQSIVVRPDELAEFVTLYWATNKGGKKMLPRQVKRGLGAAMEKFSEYQLAKWDKADKPVRIRDVMFLSHARPSNAPGNWTAQQRRMAKEYETLEHAAKVIRGAPLLESEQLYASVAGEKLATPNTWETRLSAGEDKKKVFEDLMQKRHLGGLAFIRNLRKMVEVGVDESLIRDYSRMVNINGILPFQLMMSARVMPQFESEIDKMMLRALADAPKLPGKTVVVCDVSGSMEAVLSKRKGDRSGGSYFGQRAAPDENSRMDAACGVAIMVAASAEAYEVFSFSNDAVRVPSRQGLALREAIIKSQPNGGTMLAHSLGTINRMTKYDRIIVITDEQSHDGAVAPLKGKHGYLINVATYDRKVSNGSDGWHTISGWSPSVMDYIRAHEGLNRKVEEEEQNVLD